MYLLKTLNNLSESLTLEARSNPELNPKETFHSFITKLLGNVNYDQTFVSFRDKLHVTDVNVKNDFDTPTGFYTYPLNSYLTKETILKLNEEDFRSKFPFNSELKYMYFMTLKTMDGILDHTTPLETLKSYANKIEKIYGNITPVHNICHLFITDRYKIMYNESPSHPTHLFWLLLYSIAPYIKKGPSKEAMIKIICNKIGINGFVDSIGNGYIHPAEPKQAVFFKVKNIATINIFEGVNNENEIITPNNNRIKKRLNKKTNETQFVLVQDNKKIKILNTSILYIEKFNNNLALVRTKDGYNFINQNGDLTFNQSYFRLIEFKPYQPNQQITMVKLSTEPDSVNLIDKKGNLILKNNINYSEIKDFQYFYFYKEPDQNSYTILKNNNTAKIELLLPPELFEPLE